MTAATLGNVASAGTVHYASAALTLAGPSGVLIAMGIFKLGLLTKFLSHPVIAGFISRMHCVTRLAGAIDGVFNKTKKAYGENIYNSDSM